MTTVAMPGLRGLTDAEIADAWHASGGTLDLAAITAELDRRDRAGKARARQRERHAEWEAAACAQYQAAEAYCRGNLLSEAGRRAQRDPWPMLWQGSEETARRLASEELVTFWEWQQPRVPGPGPYAASKRAALSEPEPASPPMSGAEAAELAALGQASPPAAPGSIARYMTALAALARQADQTARALRVNEERQQ